MLPGHWARRIHLRPCGKWHVFHCVFIWNDHRAVSCPWLIPSDSQGLVFPIHQPGVRTGSRGDERYCDAPSPASLVKHAVCWWTMKCAFCGYVPSNRPPYSPFKHNCLTHTHIACSSSKKRTAAWEKAKRNSLLKHFLFDRLFPP